MTEPTAKHLFAKSYSVTLASSSCFFPFLFFFFKDKIKGGGVGGMLLGNIFPTPRQITTYCCNEHEGYLPFPDSELFCAAIIPCSVQVCYHWFSINKKIRLKPCHHHVVQDTVLGHSRSRFSLCINLQGRLFAKAAVRSEELLWFCTMYIRV